MSNLIDTKLRIYESYDAGIIAESEKNQYLEVLETFMDEYNPPKTIKKDTLSQLKVSPAVKHFMLTQGGAKQNCYIKINDDEYEVRAVLTISDGEWSVEKVIKSILKDSKNKLIPIAVDSGSNYYCVDLKGTTVYRQNHEEDGFEKLCSFAEFKKEVSKAKTIKESVVTEGFLNNKKKDNQEQHDPFNEFSSSILNPNTLFKDVKNSYIDMRDYHEIENRPDLQKFIVSMVKKSMSLIDKEIDKMYDNWYDEDDGISKAQVKVMARNLFDIISMRKASKEGIYWLEIWINGVARHKDSDNFFGCHGMTALYEIDPKTCKVVKTYDVDFCG